MGTNINELSTQVAVDAGSANARRRTLRLIGGTNISLSKVDDAPGDEVEVTFDVAASGKPSVGIWESNTATLSSNLTLTDSSATIQLLKSSSTAVRTVALPTPASTNPLFIIVNDGGRFNGDLAVKYNGKLVRQIPFGNMAWFFSTGQQWFVQNYASVKFSVTGLGGPTLRWGGNTGTNRVRHFNVSSSASVANDGVSDIKLFGSGVLEKIRISPQTASGGGSYDIYINGVLSQSISAASLSYQTIGGVSTAVTTLSPTISFAANDRVQLRHNGITNSLTSTEIYGYYDSGVTYTSLAFGSDWGGWGGGFTSSAWFGGSAGATTSTPSKAIGEYTARLPLAATLSLVSWSASTAASGSTSLLIKKNGATAATVNFTAATQGVVAVPSISYAAGDSIYLEANNGTNPNDCLLMARFTVASSDVGEFIWFTGQPTAVGHRYTSLTATKGATPTTTASDTRDNVYPVAYRSTLSEIATTINSGTWTSVDVYKNGALSETVTISSNLGTAATDFDEDDALQMVCTNTNHAGNIVAVMRKTGF